MFLGVLLDVLVTVHETAGVARTEVVRSGVPVPRNSAVTAVVDANGRAVPAEFEALSDEWLLVAFPASVAAHGTTAYRLVGNVANPAPATPLRVTQNGSRFTIDTGTATFVVEPSTLFEEIRTASATIARGGALTVDDAAYASTRRAFVEHAGPLTATVVIDGMYASGLATQRRYAFTAGSATAIVRQTVSNESTTAVRLRRVRDVLTVDAPASVTARAETGETFTAPFGPAHVTQTLRASRTAPPRYELVLPGVARSGTFANAAFLSAGALGVAIDHMHRYEPQSLSVAADGTFAIDLASGDVWLGPRQALFATFAIGTDEVWARVNHPLRAWPSAPAFASVIDIPVGPLPADLADYDAAVEKVLEATVRNTDSLGVYGLMSFGLYPRAWGNPILSDEVDCFDGDPTPSEEWDDLYWCATWTDYHNTSTAAAMRAMRTGEVKWLDEIARPAALRQLHTQILQCAPDDDYFYCGQAPAGYGGYRADFNSSHAYFDNLFLYYWLTGDRAVVETLERGARSMRNYLCTRRPASACAANDAPIDEFANLTGRVASQWNATFRFVGLASGDASYYDDYRNNLERAIAQQYLELDDHGFLLGGWRPVTASGTHTTDQLWMTALYDAKLFAQLVRDTGDARFRDVLVRLARTLATYAPNTNPPWPNSLDVTWTGPRIGGSVVSVRATQGGSDPVLYDTGLATLAGPMAYAARFDPSLLPLARELTRNAIAASLADPSPLGKSQGEILARLHAAVAHLQPPPAPRRRAVRK